MRIGIGSDHAAYSVKAYLLQALQKDGYETLNCGCHTTESVHYPQFAWRVCRQLQEGNVDLGILICGTGIGMSITANKLKGIRAALIHDPFTARHAKQHNNANVLCFGARLWDSEAQAGVMHHHFTNIFLQEKFDTEGRHSQRIDLIAQIEDGVIIEEGYII